MGCLLFVLQTPVEAATIEEMLAYCRAQAEADERLACFDELARAVAEGVALPTLPSSGTGQWEVSQEISPIDDSRNVYMRLEAKDVSAEDMSYAALVVRFLEGKIDVLVGFDSRLSVRGISTEDVNAKDGIDRTALHWAVVKGHTEMADLLRRHGGEE